MQDYGAVLDHSLKDLSIRHWPFTIIYAIALRRKYNGLLELPKVPPQEFWDDEEYIRSWIDTIYQHGDTGQSDIFDGLDED